MEDLKIIGRKNEIRRLNSCIQETQSQLIIVYGRRRVGKTYLVNQFFHNTFAFKITGAYGQTRKNQFRNFAAELKRKTELWQRFSTILYMPVLYEFPDFIIRRRRTLYISWLITIQLFISVISGIITEKMNIIGAIPLIILPEGHGQDSLLNSYARIISHKSSKNWAFPVCSRKNLSGIHTEMKMKGFPEHKSI